MADDYAQHCGGCRSGRPAPITYDYLHHQRVWSDQTFGPGPRTEGVIDHIRKELVEVEQATGPEQRLEEWMDVIILALDGATRAAKALNLDVSVVLDDVAHKQALNEMRQWPDWRNVPEGKAIEHIRPLCQAVIYTPRFGDKRCLSPLPCNHEVEGYYGEWAEVKRLNEAERARLSGASPGGEY